MRRNALSIFRIYAQYEPLKVFWGGALIMGLAAGAVWIRFLVAYIGGEGAGHVQSLILGAVLFIAAMLLGALGVIGDLLAAQRTLSQRTFERVRRIELAARRRPLPLRASPAPARRARSGRTTPARRATTGDREAITHEHVRGGGRPLATPSTSTARRTPSCGG